MYSTLNPDRNNNDPEYAAFVKRRGASLIRPDFNRQDSLNKSDREQSLKRNSVLDPAKLEGGHAGGTKLMNFLKSGLNLSKFKSKSKLNLQESKQIVYYDPFFSKSEENLQGPDLDNYFSPIRCTNLVLNDYDPTLYNSIYTSDGECLYKPLVILDKECRIQQVHPSIVDGQNNCFQIVKIMKSKATTSPLYIINVNNDMFPNSQITKSCSYNSSFRDVKAASQNFESVNIIKCSSAIQRNEWIMRIKKHINPNIELTIRHEDILKIWIQEAKNLLPKKKYYCEIKLDQILYGRTTVKMMNDTVFWGEEFEFIGLENVGVVSVSVYRSTETKRKRDKTELVAIVNLPCCEVLQNSFTEKWYSPTADIRASSDYLRFSHSIPTKTLKTSISNQEEIMKSMIDSTPMLRIKARYRPLEIIPTQCYQPLVEFLIQDNIPLLISLESHLKVKSKEEFVNCLLLILQKKERHIIFLSDAVMMEVFKADDNLILRGNTMASKAIECYLKLVGEKYLLSILSDLISQVISNEMDCEVDPLRIQNSKDSSQIKNNQKKLLSLVENVWNKIFTRHHLLPEDLKNIFTIIREKLSSSKRVSSSSSPMIDQVISSCLFLRFICPAIMSPFLFGLSKEYSDKPCINRTFTLVAKCIQSLANFSQSYHGKEAYMSFLQQFLSDNSHQMHTFLKQISTKSCFQNSDYVIDLEKNVPAKADMFVDLGYQLAELSYQLSIHLRDIPLKDYTPSLTKVRSILENISKIFPKVDTEEEGFPNTLSNFRSQIPIPIQRRSSLVERKSTPLASIQYSPILKKDVEEDFSYIPTKYSSKSKNESERENYVDFESLNMRCYDEPYFRDLSLSRPCQKPKVLNEKEINDHWTKVVAESYNITSLNDNVVLDPSCCTINSSGYESLNIPLKTLKLLEKQPRTLNRNTSQNLGKSTENVINTASSIQNSPKLTPNRQPNIYKRIKRNSNVNTLPNASPNHKESNREKRFDSNLDFSLNASCDTLGSVENLSGSENVSLKSSQSMSSVYQRKHLNNKNNHNSFSNNSSNNNGESSTTNLFRRSSQCLYNSISSNVDLDSFVTNELSRLQMFFVYFDVQKPAQYQGNAVEQYKCKTLDENILKKMVVNNSQFNRQDIINYIMASYRLLKSINKPGQISTDFVVKFVMEVNQKVQLVISNEFVSMNEPTTENVMFDEQTNVLRVETVPPNLSQVSLSTQSLPSPINKYSKQSPKNSPSLETNSAMNLTKNLTVLDVFERC